VTLGDRGGSRLDDYASAWVARAADAEYLRGHGALSGCVHMAGVATECLLKDLLAQTVGAAGRVHHLTELVRRHPVLLAHVQAVPAVAAALVLINEPGGLHFIDWRYQGDMSLPDFHAHATAYALFWRWLLAEAASLGALT